jgi:hypothetical protein
MDVMIQVQVRAGGIYNCYQRKDASYVVCKESWGWHCHCSWHLNRHRKVSAVGVGYLDSELDRQWLGSSWDAYLESAGIYSCSIVTGTGPVLGRHSAGR